MKVKLLKKIRKRFGWYLRGRDLVPVLVDHQRRRTIIFSNSNLMLIKGYKTEEDMKNAVEVDFEEYRWRVFKDYIYQQFGYSIVEQMYKRSSKYAAEPTKKKRNLKPDICQEQTTPIHSETESSPSLTTT